MESITFAQACGMIYEKEMEKVFNKELAIPEFLNQSAFDSCGARGKAGSYEAEKRVDNFKAYAILRSREKKYKENHDVEKATLLSVMPEEDVELVETNAWWNQ
jgi:hypothetical protein